MLPILFRWVEMVGWVEMMMLLVSLVGWWCLSEISDKMMLGWNTLPPHAFKDDPRPAIFS